jgi:putative DNA primase/helicase
VSDTFGRGTEDYRLADWLASELEGKWRYDHAANRWHNWNGKRWAPDNTQQSMYAVASAARDAIARGTWSVGGSDLGETGVKSMLSLLKWPNIERVLKSLSTLPGYGTDGDDWDAIPYLLGVSNGVVDLRGNVLDPKPDPDCLVTKTTGVKFVPVERASEFTARAPLFMQFMGEITSEDPGMVAFLLLWFGASVFGFSPEQRFLLMTGIGRNGKGALKHAIMRAVGEYGAQFDANLYMRSKLGAARADAARADLIALKGKRITFFSEPEGNRFNEEMLKAHTGGDKIVARPLYSTNLQTWDPTHSITFLVNDAPEVEDLGPSMAARVMVADFRERFDGEREDKRLYSKLEQEREGILAILCWAASRWYRSWSTEGVGITLPDRVKEQSQRFMERNDPVANFLDEACNTGGDMRGNAGLLYEAYKEWHVRAGREGEPMSNNRFASALEKKGFRKTRTSSGVTYGGVKPKSAMELAYDDEDDG